MPGLGLVEAVVGIQFEVLEVWQVWVWAWGCRKLRCGMWRLGTWRCGRLGHLPHVAGPTCHTWQLHLPHQKGLFCHTKEVHLPPRIVPNPSPEAVPGLAQPLLTKPQNLPTNPFPQPFPNPLTIFPNYPEPFNLVKLYKT